MSIHIPTVPRRIELPKKLPKTPAECPAYIKLLVQALNDQNDIVSKALSAISGADVLANRPSPQANGSIYYATDNGHLYISFNAAWVTVV